MRRIVGVVALVAVSAFVLGVYAEEAAVTSRVVKAAQTLIGLEFTEVETDSMLSDLNDYVAAYDTLRSVEIDNSVPPALQFNPLPRGMKIENRRRRFVVSDPGNVEVPANREELAFYSVRELAELIREREITSTELTKIYIDRLKRYAPELHCVVTLTEDLAMEQAARADREIARGRYRGYLHGIPYGAKDLLALAGYPTTWGAVPYKDQVFDYDATVIRKLEDAGAVLVAKLTLGALAWGDVWFGGMTRNPWNIEQGSSGSSAGSASATAAGLVAFSIGTETWGSIVSPSTRCGTTGLRPTFGRVSRAGAMALSWSMDKIGPICRTVEDCALVLDAIIGADGIDQCVIEAPFNYDPNIRMRDIRIGYVAELFEEDYAGKDSDAATLEALRDLGARLEPIELPNYPMDAMPIILIAESAAAFDKLTRDGRDDLLVRQIKNAWPNVFRGGRFIPAVEYIQANRVRHMMIQDMQAIMKDVDVYLTPSFGGSNLLLTNLTGHPCVVMPNGFDENGSPVSITFMGRLFDEATLLAVAKAYQDATKFHTEHPPAFEVGQR